MRVRGGGGVGVRGGGGVGVRGREGEIEGGGYEDWKGVLRIAEFHS